MNLHPFVVALTSDTAEGIIKGNNDISSFFSSFGQLFLLIIVFIFIIFLAYYSTKFLASGKMIKQRSKNLVVVDSISLGLQSSVHIVKAGGKYVLIGVTKDKITCLAEIDENGLVEKISSDSKANSSFEAILGGYMSNLFKKGDKKNIGHQSDDDNEKVE